MGAGYGYGCGRGYNPVILKRDFMEDEEDLAVSEEEWAGDEEDGVLDLDIAVDSGNHNQYFLFYFIYVYFFFFIFAFFPYICFF